MVGAFQPSRRELAEIKAPHRAVRRFLRRTDRRRHLQHKVVEETCLAAAGKPGSLCKTAGARVKGFSVAPVPEQKVYTFWDYFRNHWQTMSGLRIFTCC